MFITFVIFTHFAVLVEQDFEVPTLRINLSCNFQSIRISKISVSWSGVGPPQLSSSYQADQLRSNLGLEKIKINEADG